MSTQENDSDDDKMVSERDSNRFIFSMQQLAMVASNCLFSDVELALLRRLETWGSQEKSFKRILQLDEWTR